VAASPDGRTIAVATAGKSIQIWDLESMTRVAELHDLRDDLRRIEYSPDGRYLAASTFDGRFGLWRLRNGESPVKLGNLPDNVQNYTFTLDGSRLVVARWGDEHKDLVVWDIESGRESLRLSNNAMGVNDLAISPDGRTLASAEKDRAIRIWDLSTGELRSTIHDEVGWVKTIAFSPDGRRLAFGGQDGLVKFRDLARQMNPMIVKSKKASDDVG
jgi:WD40 repeat protein